MDIVELCKKYRSEGVVAIDLAGDESLNCEANPEHRSAYEVSMAKHQQHNTSKPFLWKHEIQLKGVGCGPVLQ